MKQNDMYKGWRTESQLNKKLYQLWNAMHNRCDKHKNYKDCYVCEKWMSLKNFIEDIQKIDNYNLWKEHIYDKRNPYELDKDIKSNGINKCYCPDECIFILQKDNVKQSNKTMNYEFAKGENSYWHNNGNLMKGENNPFYGKHHTEDTKEKIKEKAKGRKLSDNTKQKISQSLNKKVCQLNGKGEVVKIWNSIKEAQETLNIFGISGCCQGKRKSAGKDKNGNKIYWKYYDDILKG